MQTEDEQKTEPSCGTGIAVSSDPEAAREELQEAVRATERALEAGVPLDQLMRRIMTNQTYMLNVLRWLVGREAERIRQAEQKE